MVNKAFVFVIKATDSATAVLRRVNREISAATRPMRELNQVTRAFTRETGLPQLAKGLRDTALAAGDVADKISSIVAP